MPPCAFLCTGEGAHAAQTDACRLAEGPSWSAVEAAVRHLGLGNLMALLSLIGVHRAPESPVITTIISMLNADRWLSTGFVPCCALGHSVGEVAAAYTAGLLSITQALETAHILGMVGAERTGAMVHSQLTHAQIGAWEATTGDLHIAVAALNGVMGASDSALVTSDANLAVCSVTLCGSSEAVDEWLVTHPEGSKKLVMPHPWHHPSYESVPGVQDGSAFSGLSANWKPRAQHAQSHVYICTSMHM